MLTPRRIAIAGMLVCAAYAAWPYVTLYRLAEAARKGDVATLQALVDWDSVREGIEEDVSDTIFDTGDGKASGAAAELPPFGYSFARGIAASQIDAQVNAEALAAALQPVPARGGSGVSPQPVPAPTLVWAFFESPTLFSVLLRPPRAAAAEPPIRLQLALQHGGWTVTRAWLPPRMLMAANAPG